jgi:hypothetical protein
MVLRRHLLSVSSHDTGLQNVQRLIREKFEYPEEAGTRNRYRTLPPRFLSFSNMTPI